MIILFEIDLCYYCNVKELEKALSTRKRAELVLKYYKIYGQKRQLLFVRQ